MDKLEQGTKLEEREALTDNNQTEVLETVEIKKVPKKVVVAIGILIVVAVAVIGIRFGPQLLKKEEPVVEEEIPILIIEPFTYTGEEKQLLQSYGYTGDQISQFETQERVVLDLVKEAQIRINKVLKERYIELSDLAQDSNSEEFKELKDDTWVGGKALEVTAENATEFRTVVERVNVDYSKVRSTGNQLFIKLTIDVETNIFMNVTPTRWLELEDEGNMVIEYTMHVLSDGSKVVINIREVLL